MAQLCSHRDIVPALFAAMNNAASNSHTARLPAVSELTEKIINNLCLCWKQIEDNGKYLGLNNAWAKELFNWMVCVYVCPQVSLVPYGVPWNKSTRPEKKK